MNAALAPLWRSSPGPFEPHELWTVVGSYVVRRAAEDEQVRQGIEHIGRVELSVYADYQRLPGELVDDVENAIGAAFRGPVLHEVIGPDMVWTLRSKPDT